MLQFYLDAGLVAIYTVAVTCVGMALLGALRRNDDISYPALLASAFFLGQGILSNIWLLISLTGHFTPWVVLAVLGGGVVVGGRSTAAAIGGLGQSLWAFTKEQHRETWAWKAVAGATLLLMLATLGRMLITPISGDAIAFYLALPKLIAHEHAMTILPTFEGAVHDLSAGGNALGGVVSSWHRSARGLVQCACGGRDGVPAAEHGDPGGSGTARAMDHPDHAVHFHHVHLLRG